MSCTTSLTRGLQLLLPLAACLLSGCRSVSREKMEECHRLSQSLRTENAQLKDQVLVLRSENQDLSERSVDDVRRIAQLEEANHRLEVSVGAYQNDRSQLISAYKELRASLPGSLQPLSLTRGEKRPAQDTPPVPDPARRPDRKPGAWVASRPESETATDPEQSEP